MCKMTTEVKKDHACGACKAFTREKSTCRIDLGFEQRELSELNVFGGEKDKLSYQ
jgi:hypothetical protein